jgi:hypothetical protein
VKGSAVETLIRAFLSKTLPNRCRVGAGVVIGADSSESAETDVLVFEGQNAAFIPSEVKAVAVEAVYAALEVKSRIETRHVAKASIDAARIKNLPRRPREMLFADPVTAEMQPVSRSTPPMAQCSLVGLSSRATLTALAKYWHRHFLDVPFGCSTDAILVLDRGVVALGSWLAQSDLPPNHISSLLNLAPSYGAGNDGASQLLFPDLFSKSWPTNGRIRVGPRVPLAIGSRLYITVNECGLDALGVHGHRMVESLGGFADAFPSVHIDAVLPLAIAADPDLLARDGQPYASDMVMRLVTQAA